MAERDAPRSPPSRDIAGEDFLFHLYRGSELLQDNRVHDAKAELEQALSLQPSDPKGQDLLGIVYFRLGLYPRAITIYEQLIKQHPDAIEPRINLALSYLKTGQPAQAHASELEKVVEQSPGHSRACELLGLAFQRLGDYERAGNAFQAGGHDGMARRLIEMTATGGALTIHPEPPAPTKAELRAAPRARRWPRSTATARRPSVRRRAPPTTRRTAPDPCAPRAAPGPPPSRGRSRRRARRCCLDPAALRQHPRRAAALGVRFGARLAPLSGQPAAPSGGSGARRAPPLPRDLPISAAREGWCRWRRRAASVPGSRRCDRWRAPAGQSTVPRARARRVLDEPLGGPASPLVELTGKVELVLGPAVGRRLAIIAIDEEGALPPRGRAGRLRVVRPGR